MCYQVLETTNPESLTVPICHDARDRCQDTYTVLPTPASNDDRYARELKSILCKAEFQVRTSRTFEKRFMKEARSDLKHDAEF